MIDPPGISFGVVILAAGASSRMGQPKMLLPWGDTTVLGHLLKTWRDLGAQHISVVHDPKNKTIGAQLNRLCVAEDSRIENPLPDRGMFSSIQCAVRWTGWSSNLTHYVIVLGDQPHLRRETLHTLIKFAAQSKTAICQPTYRERVRHPVVLASDSFKQLAFATESTLKDFLHTRQTHIAHVPIDDPGLSLDMDTPEDYAHAKQLYFA